MVLKCTRCPFKCDSVVVMQYHVGNMHPQRLTDNIKENWKESKGGL